MKHLRRGGFQDVETVGTGTHAHIPIQPGRSPLPRDIKNAALAARRSPTLKGIPVGPRALGLTDSSDVEWRG